jgi:eukaryotic-like serine/threonine-protein kinase
LWNGTVSTFQESHEGRALMAAVGSSKWLLAGKYRLIAEIGRGGMADVYLAVARGGMGGFQKLVVVKILRDGLAQEDEDCVPMFLDEARLAARLNHPNVVQTNEVGQDAGRYYLVMEYLEGQTLERIAKHPQAASRFSLAMRLQTLTQVLAGLQYAHDLVDYDGTSLRVVHRDVTPSNIFVTYDGQTKLVDFGIAKALDSSAETRVGVFKGKTRYMAPEQISQSSEVDGRTDIYAAGVVLWELLAGRRMWKGVRSADVMPRVTAGDLPSLQAAAPGVPPELERICTKALALSPDDRYPTAASLEADIERYLMSHPSPSTDRDVGSVLRQMFAEDRATMRAAVETQMGRSPSPNDTELPSVRIELGASTSTSSHSSVDSSAALPAVNNVEIDSLLEPARPAKKTRVVVVGAAAALQLTVLALVVAAIGWAWGDARKPPASGQSIRPLAVIAEGAATARAQFVRGVTGSEVLCGMSAAFSGPSRELGNRMKLGIETAFSVINDQGGAGGRTLRLIALDDGYEGSRAGDNMKELLDGRGVFAIIGNVGTPTAQVATPYAIAHKALFFGAFTGSKILRREPPDRYVFNYRASYEEETAKMVHYLADAKRIAPSSIVVFAQHDGYGDAGFDGVAKTMRKYGRGDADILRVNYERNTVDVDAAVRDVARYHDSGHRVSAVIMVATYKAAARFIQKVKDRGLSPVFLNVSFVGSNALAEELKELGPGYAPGVIVTQVVPHFESGGTGVLRYREALTRYHPDQQPDFVSLEGYVVGALFAEGLRRAGPDLNTEKLVDALESIHGYELGIGTTINFGMSEHQGSHKVWGTVLDVDGHFQSLDMD